MAQSSWPFENADTTESQYSKLFNRLKSSGVAGYPADTALKVTGDSSGMNAKVAAGFAIVRGFAYENTASVTLTIGASSANPRIDLICLKLDPTANSIVLEVVAGTPAVSPVAPTLTQTETGIYELEIGRVTVPALATVIAAGDVSDTRPCLGDAVGIWNSVQRPAGHVGQLGWSTSNQVLEVFDGSNWIEAAPKNIDASTLTSGTIPDGRLGNVPVENVEWVGSSLSAGEILVTDPGGFLVGTPAPSIQQAYYENPTVGTSFTTVGADLAVTGNSQYALTVTAHIVDTVSAATTVTLRLTVGSTNYDYQCYIASGQTGVITATRYLASAPASTTNVKARLKLSTGSGIKIQTFIVAVGTN